MGNKSCAESFVASNFDEQGSTKPAQNKKGRTFLGYALSSKSVFFYFIKTIFFTYCFPPASSFA